MEIDAVVTDLDGTFWATDMTVHERTLEVVDALDSADPDGALDALCEAHPEYASQIRAFAAQDEADVDSSSTWPVGRRSPGLKAFLWRISKGSRPTARPTRSM